RALLGINVLIALLDPVHVERLSCHCVFRRIRGHLCQARHCNEGSIPFGPATARSATADSPALPTELAGQACRRTFRRCAASGEQKPVFRPFSQSSPNPSALLRTG